MVRSPLFVKVFAWFWMALLSMLIVLWVTLRIFDPEIIGFRWTPIVENPWVSAYADEAARVYEQQGSESLREHIRQYQSSQPVQVFLFDAAGHELTGNPIQPSIRNFAAVPSAGREILVKVSYKRTLFSVPTTGPSGKRYRVVAEIPRNAGGLSPLFGQGWTWAILAAVLMLSFICYWIARNLTTPVAKVCEAARRIASGDLGVRVPDEILLARHDEFSNLGRDFNVMAGRIEDLVNAKQRLLWDVSHELRSPLTRLSLALGMARRRSTPDAMPALDRMERETEHLNRLIEQLLTLARITGGMGPALTDQVDLIEVVREVASDAAFEASGMNRSVRLDAEREGLTVPGSRDLLRSAIENVVRNALRYTAEGSEVLISAGLQEDRKSVLIQVRDHGPGVPEPALEHLFEVFYRAPETRDATAGSGLGLAITSQVVLAHGGWVKALNAPGGGLEVRIGVPVHPLALDHSADAEAKRPVPTRTTT
jgi:two-component system sensor histidine kinase CpxA